MKIATRTMFEIHEGQDVTVWLKPNGHCGQGGIVWELDAPWRITLVSGPGGVLKHTFQSHDIDRITVEVPYDADECLEHGPDCSGPVEDRWSGGSRSWPRCTRHGEDRLRRYETSMERYADSNVAPDWFDPAYAGERWGDD